MVTASHEKATRLDLLIALLIAIVSLTFAVATWRASLASSRAADASREGLTAAIRLQAYTSQNWQRVYEEAAAAENHAVALAEVEAMDSSGLPGMPEQAANLRQYLLPNLLLLAGPLAEDPKYQNPDGTYDLRGRFDDLQAESTSTGSEDPQASFQLANRYQAEQRWLIVTAVLLAISLFWLALAQVSGKRWRLPVLIIGSGVFALGLAGLVLIEGLYALVGGGGL